jgi:hypothetical protein
MAVKRYNAGIQRAKGLLEIAAALYDTSLSHQTRRAAEGVLQTDSRVGRVLRLSLARISHNGIISRAASPENTFTLDDPGRSALLPRRQTGHWTPIAAIRLCTSR